MPQPRPALLRVDLMDSGARSRAGAAIQRLYGLGCYAIAGVATPYLLLFAGDRYVPITVNTAKVAPAFTGHAAAIVIDLVLVALFGLQHSLMTVPVWKQWLARRLPPSVERSTYALATSLVVSLVVLGYRPIPGELWRLSGAWAEAMTAGYAAGFALVYVSALWLNHFHLLAQIGLVRATTSIPRSCAWTGPTSSCATPR